MRTHKHRKSSDANSARSVLQCGDPPSLSQGERHPAAGQSARGLAHFKPWRLWPACFCFLVSVFCFRAGGQSFSIDRSTIDGGGGTSTGGVYSVSGTIGQPDAGGPMTGGNFSLTGGFWSLYALQTPGAPLLSIARTATNTVAVFWPSPSTGCQLQVNTNSVSSVNWSNVITTPADDGTTRTVIINPPTGNRFYRLIKP